MKKKKNHMKKNLFMLAFLLMVLSIQPVMAQEGFDPDVDDQPAAPIDGYLYTGLIAGACIAILKLRKRQIV